MCRSWAGCSASRPRQVPPVTALLGCALLRKGRTSLAPWTRRRRRHLIAEWATISRAISRGQWAASRVKSLPIGPRARTSLSVSFRQPTVAANSSSQPAHRAAHARREGPSRTSRTTRHLSTGQGRSRLALSHPLAHMLPMGLMRVARSSMHAGMTVLSNRWE